MRMEIIFNHIKELEYLYGNVFKRRDIRYWQDFFKEFDAAEFDDWSGAICSFFNENADIPHDIWRFLDGKLSLSKNSDFKWPELIKHDFGLSFDYFNENINCDYALYSRLRFKAFKELLEGNYQCASVSAQEAFNIYDKDAVLHKISGISNYMTGEYEKAIEAFSRVLVINPSDVDSLSYRGNIYFKKGDFKNAQKDYEEALKLVHESFYLKKRILKCMYEQKEYKIAEKFLRSMTLKGYQDFELDIMANTLIKPNLIDKLAKVKNASGLVKKIKNAIFSNGITIILFFAVAISLVAVLLSLFIFFVASYCPYLIPVVFVAAALLIAFKIYKDSYGGN